MHVLDKGLYSLAHDTLSIDRGPSGSLALQLIVDERLAKYSDQWPVTRQENGVRVVIDAMLCRDVQANQRLAGTGNSGHEHDGLLAALTGSRDDFFDAAGRRMEVACAGIVARDGLDRVLSVQGARGFDDRRAGTVRRATPSRSEE